MLSVLSPQRMHSIAEGCDTMCWFGNVHLMEPYVKTWARGHYVVGSVDLLCLGVEPGPERSNPAHCQMGRAG